MFSLLLLLVGMALVLGGILWLRLPAFLALVAGALVIAFLTPQTALKQYVASEMARDGVMDEAKLTAAQQALVDAGPVERMVKGFGATCASVGILIAMASVIGVCLLESGAARRLVEAVLAAFGVARAHFAFLFSGFFLAIPVYFDTVFYLLIPLAKAMRRRTGKHYLLYVLTIVAGGTMAHSLVPPTPGPLFVAAALNVEIGTMMIAGFIVGVFAAGFGYVWAVWKDRHHEIAFAEEDPDHDETSRAVPAALPPLWLAGLPVLLPIVWLATGSAVSAQGGSGRWVDLLADKNLALIVGAALALVMLTFYGGKSGEEKREQIQTALQSGAGIILITAAGGAFGTVLRQTGIGADISGLLGSSAAWLALPVVFLVTAVVRTAQGSATVAMITAAPVAMAFLPQVAFHPVYLALAVGSGSKPIPWMNDSGFWIITRMSGMKESETLRFVTPMMSLMGVVGLIVTLIGAWLFPMS